MAGQRDSMTSADSIDAVDPIERLLQAAAEAESVGVFAATPIDAGRVLRESSQVPVPLRITIGRKWVPVAAVIGIAAVVWSTMFYVKLSDIGERSRLVSATIRENQTIPGNQTIPENAVSPAHIALCVSGPAGSDAVNCADGRYDFDTDGDIDLADYSRFQLAFAQ